MTTPFIKQLWESKKFEIDYMCWTWVSQILIWNKFINKIIDFDEKFFSKINLLNLLKFAKFLWFLLSVRKNYEYVIILDKHIIFNFMFFITWYKNRFWFNRLWKEWKLLNKSIYWNKAKREVEYYLDFLELFWVKADYKKQKYDFFWWIIGKINSWIELSNEEERLVNKYLKKKDEIDRFINNLQKTWKNIIWIASWGGNLLMPKNDCRWWNIENWRGLSVKLLEDSIVLLLWSKNDRNISLTLDNFYNLLGKYNIHETIYLVSKLSLVISQEAWFIHFVWCTNTKLLTIAWPTNPYRFHPFNDNWEKQWLWWIWKEKYECYDEYWSFGACRGDEINQISIKEVLNQI